MSDLLVRPVGHSDRRWLETLTRLHFGSEKMIVHGSVYFPAEKPGFIAVLGKKRVGAIALEMRSKTCEILLVDALEMREEIIHAMLKTTVKHARASGCRRVIISTTNDNADALRIYQQYGFHLREIRLAAVSAARKLKPEIPETGAYGIPIRDEIELELIL